MEDRKDREKKAAEVADKIIKLSRDSILMNLRFIDVAIARLKPSERPGTDCICSDGRSFFYDPLWVIHKYKKETASISRAYLHVLFHFVFYHSFRNDKLERELWNLATDMAVENTVMELELPGYGLKRDLEKQETLRALSQKGIGLTAERLYRYYKENMPDFGEFEELKRLFVVDDHGLWSDEEQMNISLAEWKKLSEQLKADIGSFSKGKNKGDSLKENLLEATKDRVDYTEFLKRFVVPGESVRVNEDEFDYIYYHLGMEYYGNMPLVEPLEYRDIQKIRDFVIAIDTSASCRGKLVRAFLNKTYSILKTSSAFFEKMNVHILQCDNELQSDVVIHNQEEFDAYLMSGKLKGFGNTDFRPVFERVDELIRTGELTNLRGLIYFTDGVGIYPEKAPEYDTVFAFIDDGLREYEVPGWAVKILMQDEDLEREEE